MPTFYINAKTQHENLGDAVITRQLIELSRQLGPVRVQTVNIPAHFQKTLHLSPGEAVPTVSAFLISLIKAGLMWRFGAKRSSGPVIYLLNPGGFEGDYRGVQVVRQYVLVVAYVFLRLLGVRLMRIGCSLGPFGPPSRPCSTMAVCRLFLSGCTKFSR